MADGVSRRQRQISDELRRRVAVMLKKKVRDARLNQVTIMSVSVSPDLKNASIYYMVPDGVDRAITSQAFCEAEGFFSYELARDMKVRVVPKLKFIYDEVSYIQ